MWALAKTRPAKRGKVHSLVRSAGGRAGLFARLSIHLIHSDCRTALTLCVVGWFEGNNTHAGLHSGIDLYAALARFEPGAAGDRRLSFVDGLGRHGVVAAKNVIIATGGRPFLPSDEATPGACVICDFHVRKCLFVGQTGTTCTSFCGI